MMSEYRPWAWHFRARTAFAEFVSRVFGKDRGWIVGLYLGVYGWFIIGRHAVQVGRYIMTCDE